MSQNIGNIIKKNIYEGSSEAEGLIHLREETPTIFFINLVPGRGPVLLTFNTACMMSQPYFEEKWWTNSILGKP